jgi:hypothetical protein
MSETDLNLLGLCEHGQEPELGNAILKAVEVGQELQFIQETLRRRLSMGLVLRDDALAHVLASAPNRDLWELAWPGIERNPRATLTLFNAGYSRPEIETALCARLFEEFKTDSVNDVPRLILEAFEQKGTGAALPTLHSILCKLEPRTAADGHFAPMLGVVEGLIGQWRIEMAELAQKAIRAIDERAAFSAAEDQKKGGDLQGKAAAEKALANARQYEEIDPEVSAHYSRKSAEALAKWWYRAYGLERAGAKPAKHLMLGDLTRALDKAGAPGIFVNLLKSCQPLSNFASHDQDEGSGQLTADIASNLIRFVEQALQFEPPAERMLNASGQ